MSKNKTILIVFIILLILAPNTAAAQYIDPFTYTFNHSACATEDPSVCICDTYDTATDTCTISEKHQYYPRYSYNSPPSNLTLNFNNIEFTSGGSISIYTNYYYSYLSKDKITINTSTITQSDNTYISSPLIEITADQITTSGIIGKTQDIYYLHADSISINTQKLNVTDEGIIAIGSSNQYRYNNNRETYIDINAEDITVSGTIGHKSGQYNYNYYTLQTVTINTGNLTVTDTGAITVSSYYYDYYYSTDKKNAKIDITAKKVDNAGKISGSGRYTYYGPDITIKSEDILISGTLDSTGAHSSGVILLESTTLNITGTIKCSGSRYYYANQGGSIVIDSKDIDISGTIKSSDIYNTPAKVLITAEKFHLSGTITNKGSTYYRWWYASKNRGIISINSDEIILEDSARISTGRHETHYYYYYYDNDYSDLFITYCAMDPVICTKPTGCEQIDADADQVIFNNNCEDQKATCKYGDGCMATDPITKLPCTPHDPDCPVAETGIAAQTIISLQGTVYDLQSNRIGGTIQISSLEECPDIECNQSAEVLIPTATYTFANGVINQQLGPYELIPNVIYKISLNVTSNGKTDIVDIKFTG